MVMYNTAGQEVTATGVIVPGGRVLSGAAAYAASQVAASQPVQVQTPQGPVTLSQPEAAAIRANPGTAPASVVSQLGRGNIGGSSFWDSWRNDLLSTLSFIPSFFAMSGGGGGAAQAAPSGLPAYSQPVATESNGYPFALQTDPGTPASGYGFMPGYIAGGMGRGVPADTVQAVTDPSGVSSLPQGSGAFVTPGNLADQTPDAVQRGLVDLGLITPSGLPGARSEPIQGGIVTAESLSTPAPTDIVHDVIAAGGDVLSWLLGAAVTVLPFLRFIPSGAAPGANPLDGQGGGGGGAAGGAGAAGSGELFGTDGVIAGVLKGIPTPVKVAGAALLALGAYAGGRKYLKG